MKIKLLILALMVLCVGVYASDGAYLLGGDNQGSFNYSDDLSLPFKNHFDIPMTFDTTSSLQNIITDKAAIVFTASRIFSYELSSGKELWKYPKDQANSENISSTAFCYNGKVYFTASSYLYCMDELTGKIYWKKDVAGTLKPIIKVDKGVMYLTVSNGKVYRLNPETGESVASVVSLNSSNVVNLLIKDNYIVAVKDNHEMVCVDLNKPDKIKFNMQVPGSAMRYSQSIVGDYIMVTSSEKVVLYSLSTGREYAKAVLPTDSTAAAISNGKEIFVSCINGVYSFKIEKSKKLPEAYKSFQVPNTIKNFIAINDKNLIAQDAKGLITTYEIGTNKVVWQYQPGMYTAGGVTTTVPGVGTSDITVIQNYSTGGAGGNMGGGAGGRGGRNGGGRGGRGGAMRSEAVNLSNDLVFEGTLMAQGRGGRGGRGGMMGGGMPGGMGGMDMGGMNGMGGMTGMPGMGGMTGMGTTTETIEYVNVLSQDGNMYTVDMDKFYNDPYRQFVPSSIISYPSYSNGYIGFVTSDNHFVVRCVNAPDKKAPYTFEVAPGSKSTNKTVSAVNDILVKVCAFDKGSGINYKTATLSAVDANGTSYTSHLIYAPVTQTFYGYIKANKSGSIVSSFPDGEMKCVFTFEDYAGNKLVKEFSFRLDASVATKDEKVPGGSYYDVETGELMDFSSTLFSPNSFN